MNESFPDLLFISIAREAVKRQAKWSDNRAFATVLTGNEIQLMDFTICFFAARGTFSSIDNNQHGKRWGWSSECDI